MTLQGVSHVMAPDANGTGDVPKMNRRNVLKATAGSAIALTGLAAFGGTAAAWDRYEVEFKGCSSVWVITNTKTLTESSLLVVRVVVATDDGVECRRMEVTKDNTAPVPGQYGDAQVFKYDAGEDEKVIGIIHYGSPEDSIFCMTVNDNRCAQNAPDPTKAQCVIDAFDTFSKDVKVCNSASASRRRGPRR